MAKSDYVVASRFHCMVLAFLCQKAVFPVSYNLKIANYLKDLGFKGKYVKIENIAELNEEDYLYNFNEKIITDVTGHKALAEEQFKAFAEFIAL